MKNLITFLLYCLSITVVIGQAASQTRVLVLSKSDTETTLNLSLTGIDKTPVSTPQGDAFVVGIDKGTPLLQAGAPDLPKFATLLAIPSTGNMAVEIIASEYQDFPNMAVAPSKGNLLRTVDPATVPFIYGPQYEHDEFFPGRLADLQQPFVMRDQRGLALWMYPVQYNPVTKVLRVYANITLRVYHTGGTGQNEADSKRDRGNSPAFNQLYQKIFLNYSASAQSRSGQTPERMLIIAKDEFLSDLEPFVAWKRQMGIYTTVTPASEVGADPAALYNYVRDFYLENNNTYLLLVGDEYAIPPMVRPGSNYSCDNCLGYMEGDDHFSEVLVGRFHASNSAQLKIMINRNLDYEKTPLADQALNWCASGMASTSNQGAGIGDDGQADFDQGNEWKSKHLADGYEKYWEFYDGDQSAISPTPNDETADKPGDPVNTQLVDLMNSRGVSLYNYTGHGWEQGLSSGNFNTGAVATLRNAHRYPIIIGVACCAGNFTNNGGGDCLGEALQRAGDPVSGEAWGGIAGLFSSDFQSWAPPMEGQDGMNQYLLDADGIALHPNLGAMAAFGNTLMIAAYGQGGIDMADTWNPFFDPSTAPRSQLPLSLIATHPAGMFVGSTSLTVHCDVEGALIGLYWQGQTLAVATVEGGLASLEFPPLDNIGDLTVTATQFNYSPYQGNIAVTVAGGAFVVNQALTLDDTAGGNGNQKADFGESLVYNLTLGNVGDLIANATSVTLSTSDDNVVITDDTELFGDIDYGSSVEKTAAFAFKVNDDVSDGHVVYFNLHIEYNNGAQTFDAIIAEQLQAPEIAVGSFQLLDVQGGDGDNRLESGEVAMVTIKNGNSGQSSSSSAQGHLVSDSPWLSISDAVNLGPINALGGTADAVFYVTVSANAPQVVQANFHYTVQAGNYGAEKDFGPFTINAIIETFETSNFEGFPWDMSGNKPWLITQSGPYTGASCSRSGAITNGQQSDMNLTLDFALDGTVSFARKVSSEPDYDFLRFLIDDVEVAKWSGVVPWGEVGFPITAGLHKLSWIYQKDNVASANSDRAWVDDISLPPYQIIVGTHNVDPGAFQFSILPNPTPGRTRLQMDIPTAQHFDIEVFDCFGRRVETYESPVQFLAGSYKVELDLRRLTPGLYFVQVRGAGATKVMKVVRE